MSHDIGQVIIGGEAVGEFFYGNTVDMAPDGWLHGIGRTWHEVRENQPWPSGPPCTHERATVILQTSNMHWPAEACRECRRIYSGCGPYGIPTAYDEPDDVPEFLHRGAAVGCVECRKDEALARINAVTGAASLHPENAIARAVGAVGCWVAITIDMNGPRAKAMETETGRKFYAMAAAGARILCREAASIGMVGIVDITVALGQAIDGGVHHDPSVTAEILERALRLATTTPICQPEK